MKGRKEGKREKERKDERGETEEKDEKGEKGERKGRDHWRVRRLPFVSRRNLLLFLRTFMLFFSVPFEELSNVSAPPFGLRRTAPKGNISRTGEDRTEEKGGREGNI
jgi:hypothetical protein